MVARRLSFVALAAAGASYVSAKVACPVGQSYLSVKVHQADVSRCTDPTTEPDPYVIVTVLDDTVKGLTPQRTHIEGNNARPKWNQVLEFGCVTSDSPIVFTVNDHDFTQEENCLGPIQVQGWPTSGVTQQVCATAPADPMTLPSDCLSFSLFYVPGTETPVPDLPADTGSPGEAGIIDVINPVDQGTGAAPKETPLPAVEPIPDNPSVNPQPDVEPVPVPMPEDPAVTPDEPVIEDPTPISPELNQGAVKSKAKRGGLKGSKLAGAVSGSLLGFLALAAVGMVAFMIYARRSRRYALHLDDDMSSSAPQQSSAPANLEAGSQSQGVNSASMVL